MYALPRGPSKIVASTRRRGPPRVDVTCENTQGPLRNGMMSASANMVPVFNTVKHRSSVPRQHQQQSNGQMSPEHAEAVRYLKETWDKTMQEYSKFKKHGPEWYRVKEPIHPSYAERPRLNWEEFLKSMAKKNANNTDS